MSELRIGLLILDESLKQSLIHLFSNIGYKKLFFLDSVENQSLDFDLVMTSGDSYSHFHIISSLREKLNYLVLIDNEDNKHYSIDFNVNLVIKPVIDQDMLKLLVSHALGQKLKLRSTLLIFGAELGQVVCDFVASPLMKGHWKKCLVVENDNIDEESIINDHQKNLGAIFIDQRAPNLFRLRKFIYSLKRTSWGRDIPVILSGESLQFFHSFGRNCNLIFTPSKKFRYQENFFQNLNKRIFTQEEMKINLMEAKKFLVKKDYFSAKKFLNQGEKLDKQRWELLVLQAKYYSKMGDSKQMMEKIKLIETWNPSSYWTISYRKQLENPLKKMHSLFRTEKRV